MHTSFTGYKGLFPTILFRTPRIPGMISRIQGNSPLTMRMRSASTDRFRAPATVDFNVNGSCNLNCTWCWGPDHKAKEVLTIEQWKDIATKLKALGTKNITFTGGETLMKVGLEDILSHCHQVLSLRTTLSTNGILLKRKAHAVLPFVDDIGLPLDGHTREINNVMRVGSPKHFDRVLEAIKYVQQDFSRIDLTVRTVVSAKNLDSVPLIGSTLLRNGINPEKIRWKIYQVNPIGLRKNDTLSGGWAISLEAFEEVIAKVTKTNREFPYITVQPCAKHVGRYFHIYPDGKTHILVPGRDGSPVELPTGNIAKNFDFVMNNINEFDFSGNAIRSETDLGF